MKVERSSEPLERFKRIVYAMVLCSFLPTSIPATTVGAHYVATAQDASSVDLCD